MECENTATIAAAIIDREHVTPRRRTDTCHRDLWPFRFLPFALGSDLNRPSCSLRPHTPPDALARDSLLVADLLARGSVLSAAFPGTTPSPVASLAEGYPLTVAG